MAPPATQSILARAPIYAKVGAALGVVILTASAYWFVFYSLREQRARDLNKLLPADAQEDAFLSSVQQASNSAGVDLKAYAPQEEIGQNFYAKVPMKLEITGKFHQIAKFAYDLGKVDRIINVEDIELTEPKVVGEEVFLKARCLATAFHAIKPKETSRGGAGTGSAASSAGRPQSTAGTP
jgi:type IV pilus assembly protein PilO